MSKIAMPQRKRLACGHKISKYASGGMVVPGGVGLKTKQLVELPPMNPDPSRRGPASPITMAKRQNGIVGMKKGGKCR